MPEKKLFSLKKKGGACLETELLTVQSHGSGDRQAWGVLPSPTAPSSGSKPHVRTGTKEMACLQLLLSVRLAVERLKLRTAFIFRVS